ncbi:uncharacterized protein PG998_013078 [Apiospora kogelbergensis]|uniref:uncharacterized protein n=1 Tax=Apiospora kogelbergensis TaxID=1337665 RepID=UPI00312F2956
MVAEKVVIRNPFGTTYLTTLSVELLHAIAALFLLPDQAALARTCKRLNSALTPIVWREIELLVRGNAGHMDVLVFKVVSPNAGT